MPFVGGTSSATTFTLNLQFGNKFAIALVDSGSEISFINAKFDVKHNFQMSPTPPLQVAAANGTNMLSETACLACPYSIQEHAFSSDFKILEVHGYDIILGADWIYNHSPVGLDLKTRQFSLNHYGTKIITLQDDSSLPSIYS